MNSEKSTGYKFIKVSKQDSLSFIHLHRPEVKNALTFEMFYEIKSAFETIREDNDVQIIILTGYKSEKYNYFSSGIDLNELKQLQMENTSAEQLEKTITGLQECVATIEFINKPVFAVINDFCFGSALELALACDFIVAAPKTKFGLLETKYGIIPDLGGTYRLIRRIGFQHAKRMIMFSAIHSADELAQKNINLVDWVVEKSEQQQFMLQLCQQLLANNYQAINVANNLVREIYPMVHREVSRLEKTAQLQLLLEN